MHKKHRNRKITSVTVAVSTPDKVSNTTGGLTKRSWPQLSPCRRQLTWPPALTAGFGQILDQGEASQDHSPLPHPLTLPGVTMGPCPLPGPRQSQDQPHTSTKSPWSPTQLSTLGGMPWGLKCTCPQVWTPTQMCFLHFIFSKLQSTEAIPTCGGSPRSFLVSQVLGSTGVVSFCLHTLEFFQILKVFFTKLLKVFGKIPWVFKEFLWFFSLYTHEKTSSQEEYQDLSWMWQDCYFLRG